MKFPFSFDLFPCNPNTFLPANKSIIDCFSNIILNNGGPSVRSYHMKPNPDMIHLNLYMKKYDQNFVYPLEAVVASFHTTVKDILHNP